jgi:hypothetical protein
MHTLLKDEPDVLERLFEASNEQFVALSSDFRFCPFPGCHGVVHRLPQPTFTNGGFDAKFLDYTGATCVAIAGESRIGDGCTLTYEGVEDLDYNNCHSTKQPRKAHRFCFSCGDSVHWPITCERLEEWKQKIQEEIGEFNDGSDEGDFNDIAQKMWLRANTRPCPECNVPIEKNDGCNHMTCTNQNCLHEFCWICRKDWKLHGTATGGFFRCNIWQEDESGIERREEEVNSVPQPQEFDAVNPLEPVNDEGYGTAIYSAREAWKKKQEMNRFIHHYTRWEAHRESAALERKMGDSVCTRLAPVVEAAMEFDGSPVFNFGGQGLSFVHSAFTELLECRSMLRHSYAFSYLRYPTFSSAGHRYTHLYGKRKEKLQFERVQSELEILTEQMSDIVARSHLRATKVQISFLTASAAEKRVEFSNLMFQIFKEEKKEIAKHKQRKADEEKYGSRSQSSRSPRSSRSPSNATGTLSQLVAMHQRTEHRFDDHDLNRALDGFLARMGRIDHHRHGHRHQDRIDDQGDGPIQMWACQRCTYMNTGGLRCAMCASMR